MFCTPSVKTTPVQTEICEAAARLSLTRQQFEQLSASEAEIVYRTCLSSFVTASFEPRWWWEHFREPQARLDASGHQLAFTLIIDLIPDPDMSCYFIAEDDQAPFYPAYRSSPRTVVSIIGECFGFEYYLTPLDYTWLICESHHDEIYGVGEPIVSRLNAHVAAT